MNALEKIDQCLQGFSNPDERTFAYSLFSQHLPLFPVLLFYGAINISQTLFSLLQNQNGRLTVTALS